MARLGLLLALSLSACTDRGLDAPGIDDNTLVTHDLAGPTTPGKPTFDLAGPITGGDVDLAVSSGTSGVPCGSMTCSAGETCCVSFSGASCMMGGMGGGCGMQSASFRCDGPEDCEMGQRCAAEGGGGGFIFGTRCRGQMSGMGKTVCHTSADCPNGGACTPAMTLPNAPPLSVCD